MFHLPCGFYNLRDVVDRLTLAEADGLSKGVEEWGVSASVLSRRVFISHLAYTCRLNLSSDKAESFRPFF